MDDLDRVVDPATQLELLVPPFATAERAIARAAMERDGRLRRIRLYPDGTYAWSLWEEGGGMPTPSELGLSEQLASDLRDWFEDWNANFRYDGPQDEDFSRRWLARGTELTVRLEEETWDFAEIVPGGGGWDAAGATWSA